MKFRKPTALTSWINLCVIAAIIISSGPANPAEATLKKVTVAYTSYSPSVLWFLLEKELGFFREEGLRPEFILVRGGGVAVRGLMAGNFDYVHSTSVVIDAIIRGSQPFKIVLSASLIRYWLIAQPDIRSVTDLKGKTIATGSPGSISDLIIREILKQHGLDPLKDATFVGTGASRERFTALTSKAVHASVLSPPFNLKALEMGYGKLAKTNDYVKWPGAGLGTKEEKILQDPQEVSKMVRASLKGLKVVLTQREYILSKIMQMFRLSREEALQTYETLGEEFVPPGYFTVQEEHTIISMAKQAANVTENIPPERVFDNRFVKQVEQELKSWVPKVPR